MKNVTVVKSYEKVIENQKIILKENRGKSGIYI
jgi:hypothetical protein